MKSKMIGKKALIVIPLAVIILLLGSFAANAAVVAPRIQKMQYEKEYGTDVTTDGLYIVKYEPTATGEKIADIIWFIGADYGLDSAVIPASTNGIKIEHITEESFSNCRSVKSVTLSDGIAGIDKNAFLNCDNLQKVYIPASVKTIDKSAFTDCKTVRFYVQEGSYAEDYARSNNLKYSYYQPKDSNIKSAKAVQNKVYNDFQYNTFYYGGRLNCAITGYNPTDDKSSITVPEKIDGIEVTAIACEAFAHAQSLKTVTLPPTVKSVGRNAFADCSCLQKVVLKGDVKFIDQTAFADSENAKICK